MSTSVSDSRQDQNSPSSICAFEHFEFVIAHNSGGGGYIVGNEDGLGRSLKACKGDDFAVEEEQAEGDLNL